MIKATRRVCRRLYVVAQRARGSEQSPDRPLAQLPWLLLLLALPLAAIAVLLIPMEMRGAIQAG